MAKKVAVMAVNPVNGFGLFSYLEAFFENGIPYDVYAVADSNTIKTNSGITLVLNKVISELKGHSDDYDALVFACGDAMPKFSENLSAEYNQDMLSVIKEFGASNKIIAGHCVGGFIFDMCGITAGKKISSHPFVQQAIKLGTYTSKPYSVDGNLYTAQTERSLNQLIPELISVLK